MLQGINRAVWGGEGFTERQQYIIDTLALLDGVSLKEQRQDDAWAELYARGRG